MTATANAIESNPPVHLLIFVLLAANAVDSIAQSVFLGITVSRSLGDQPATLVGVIQKPSVSVRQLDASSLCLVLASDGIWDVMKDNEVTPPSIHTRSL